MLPKSHLITPISHLIILNQLVKFHNSHIDLITPISHSIIFNPMVTFGNSHIAFDNSHILFDNFPNKFGNSHITFDYYHITVKLSHLITHIISPKYNQGKLKLGTERH